MAIQVTISGPDAVHTGDKPGGPLGLGVRGRPILKGIPLLRLLLLFLLWLLLLLLSRDASVATLPAVGLAPARTHRGPLSAIPISILAVSVLTNDMPAISEMCFSQPNRKLAPTLLEPSTFRKGVGAQEESKGWEVA